MFDDSNSYSELQFDEVAATKLTKLAKVARIMHEVVHDYSTQSVYS